MQGKEGGRRLNCDLRLLFPSCSASCVFALLFDLNAACKSNSQSHLVPGSLDQGKNCTTAQENGECFPLLDLTSAGSYGRIWDFWGYGMLLCHCACCSCTALCCFSQPLVHVPILAFLRRALPMVKNLLHLLKIGVWYMNGGVGCGWVRLNPGYVMLCSELAVAT